MEILLLLTLLAILGAEFVNGWTDAPNAICTVVSTRVLSLRTAIVIASILNAAGILWSLWFGVKVATTIGKGIVATEFVDHITIASAMLTIIIWSTLAWYYDGLPTSESHALIAALSGAGVASSGWNALLWAGWKKVLIGLMCSSILGLVCAFLFTWCVIRISRLMTRNQTRRTFSFLQMISASFMAFSHGMNDGQKFIGVFVLALMTGGFLSSFDVPLWVVLLCAFVMALGTSLGGWRIIRTMGIRLVHLEPFQGFTAEASSSCVIILASFFGIPVSTTHTIGTSIVGAGLAHRSSCMKLGTLRNIISAWILTFPACGVLAFFITLLLRSIF